MSSAGEEDQGQKNAQPRSALRVRTCVGGRVALLLRERQPARNRVGGLCQRQSPKRRRHMPRGAVTLIFALRVERSNLGVHTIGAKP